MSLPKYPVYVPSKSRYDSALTAKFLTRDRVPFYLVVEEQEFDEYRRVVPEKQILVLPDSNRGLIFARNFCMDHSLSIGAKRHWQLDDNIGGVRRLYGGERIPCDSGPGFRAIEEFVDRYRNVALAGFNYQMFVTPTSPPYRTNVHVYSGTLVNNAIPHRWRLLYNDDTDLCLQVLADGFATVLVNVFMIDKKTTMTVKGGNYTAEGPISYQGDGRLRMARALESAWPGIVTTGWRWGRPQHVVDWGRFTTPLELRDDVDLAALPARDEFGLRLEEVRPVESEYLRGLLDRFQEQPTPITEARS